MVCDGCNCFQHPPSGLFILQVGLQAGGVVLGDFGYIVRKCYLTTEGTESTEGGFQVV